MLQIGENKKLFYKTSPVSQTPGVDYVKRRNTRVQNTTRTWEDALFTFYFNSVKQL